MKTICWFCRLCQEWCQNMESILDDWWHWNGEKKAQMKINTAQAPLSDVLIGRQRSELFPKETGIPQLKLQCRSGCAFSFPSAFTIGKLAFWLTGHVTFPDGLFRSISGKNIYLSEGDQHSLAVSIFTCLLSSSWTWLHQKFTIDAWTDAVRVASFFCVTVKTYSNGFLSRTLLTC